MSGSVAQAMKAGAGLPVLSPLDRYLETRALDKDQTPPEDAVIHQVLDATEAWLDSVEGRARDRLDACDEGALVARLRRFTDDRLQAAIQRIDDVRTANRDPPAPWDALVQLLIDLHGVRQDLHDVQRAAAHLAELARLATDIPDDEDGRAALDDLAALEAEAAAREDPTAWAQTAADLERRALDAIRLDRASTPSEPTPAPDPELAPAEDPRRELGPEPRTDPDPPEDENRGPTVGFDAGSPANGNGRGNGHRIVDASPYDQTNAAAPPHRSPRLAPQGENGQATHRPKADPQAPTTASRTGLAEAAGPDVLAEWEGIETPSDLRHAPLWAPILEGDVVPGEGTVEDLIDHVRRVEVDLVDLELPRVLAIATGADPEVVRHRIAERAAEITRRQPERPAREAFLDYVTGKLPRRYRATSEGLALVASIAHALCTDDPGPTAVPTTTRPCDAWSRGSSNAPPPSTSPTWPPASSARPPPPPTSSRRPPPSWPPRTIGSRSTRRASSSG